MILFLHHQQPLNQIFLQFRNPRVVDDQDVLFHGFPLSPSREEDVGEIDYGIFFSIDSLVLRFIATELDDYDALVTLTNSEVKFSVNDKEISLYKEVDECIIGGVADEEESRFFVYLNPKILFRDLANKSERIWMFKSPNSYSIIVAPIGLYAQFCVYFPQLEEKSKRQRIC
ncbi:hypothetical protein Csa_005727 [Cucumis sativus]|uniref:Uncharacterized protein n=2 Tax=Cucumis sativus TaxID=3659 RepID=A0A0A0KCY3_CUCSA|nr:hypothetical protein Csa_005727 [Cucumis sativus]